MKDLAIALAHRPRALAEMGAALGKAGISIEGGGVWVVNDEAVAHFLFEDEADARTALEGNGIRVLAEHKVLVQRLDQEQPGQLGKISQKMAEAGVNIEVMYSDHDHNLILVVDDMEKGRQVSEAWTNERPRVHLETRPKELSYEVGVEWTGNDGEGTETYRSYRRDHVITCAGKAPIAGSSDPAFRGDHSLYNPEELLISSLAACHMLWYLHLCSVNQVKVVQYRDRAYGVLEEWRDGTGKMARVDLRPAVRIARNCDRDKARKLHEEAHHLCFIARSVNFPVKVMPEIEHAP